MAEMDGNLNLYKTPSTEILRHRKEFYGLWKRCDDQTGTWLNRIQNQIDRCDFPPVISPEYLLIDKFVCELDDNAREFIQSIDTWTLTKLKEYFVEQKIDLNNRVNVNILVNKRINQQIPSQTVAVECKFDGYEYSENIANIEFADESNSFIKLESEPDQDLSSSTIFSDDNEAEWASIELDSDTINKILINDMKCETEDYKFSINDATAIDETNDTNGKLSVHPVKENALTRKKSNVCDQCHKSFSTSSKLKAHEKAIHQGILPYRCPKCDKCYISAHSLERHFCKRAGEKSFACDQCHKSFRSAYTLANHKKEVHRSISPCICDICNKSYAYVSLIKRHMVTHIGKRPFQCDQCVKSFARKYSLKKHKDRIHQGIRLHACVECDRCFSNTHELERHFRKHTGERPFVCGQCNKTFPHLFNLNAHLRTHSSVKPLSCDQCSKTFHQLCKLKNHKKTVHDRTTTEDGQ